MPKAYSVQECTDLDGMRSASGAKNSVMHGSLRTMYNTPNEINELVMHGSECLYVVGPIQA
jgi:hypothetical protein